MKNRKNNYQHNIELLASVGFDWPVTGMVLIDDSGVNFEIEYTTYVCKDHGTPIRRVITYTMPLIDYCIETNMSSFLKNNKFVSIDIKNIEKEK